MFFTILTCLCLLAVIVAGYWVLFGQAAFWNGKLVKGKTAPAGVRFLLFLGHLCAWVCFLKGIYGQDWTMIVICGIVVLSQLLLWNKRWKLKSYAYMTRKNLVWLLLVCSISVAGAGYVNKCHQEYKWKHARCYEVTGYTLQTETEEDVRGDSLFRKTIAVKTKQTHVILNNGKKISLRDNELSDIQRFWKIGDTVRVYDNTVVQPLN